jgi:hypothetical protein
VPAGHNRLSGVVPECPVSPDLEGPWEIYTFHDEQKARDTWRAPVSPYFHSIDAYGRIAAKGIANRPEHLDRLMALKPPAFRPTRLGSSLRSAERRDDPWNSSHGTTVVWRHRRGWRRPGNEPQALCRQYAASRAGGWDGPRQPHACPSEGMGYAHMWSRWTDDAMGLPLRIDGGMPFERVQHVWMHRYSQGLQLLESRKRIWELLLVFSVLLLFRLAGLLAVL